MSSPADALDQGPRASAGLGLAGAAALEPARPAQRRFGDRALPIPPWKAAAGASSAAVAAATAMAMATAMTTSMTYR